MEVGAVKQAYNNELILLKKKLNQAKIQIIHKLTRKAKTFAEKKAPDPLKEKLKRKAESAVKEVLIIKKVKARDLGKFIVTQKGQLHEYLNRPEVDLDKACARLLLHKALQDKYKFIKNRFAEVPIKDLLMSRQERLKMKKEAREKQKNKRDKKKNSKVVNAEGDWDVEDVTKDSKKFYNDDEKMSDAENVSDIDKRLVDDKGSDDDKMSGDENGTADEMGDNGSEAPNSEDEIQNSDSDESAGLDAESEESETENVEEAESGKLIKLSPVIKENKPVIRKATVRNLETKILPQNNKKPDKKHKDNKNLNEKILNRKFKKDSDEATISATKVVDPFFITSTGENYMTLAEPRQPDEVKEVHKQGNRQLRRAIMFGHVPKPKPRQNRQDNFNRQGQDTYRQDNYNRQGQGNYNRQNGFDRSNDKFDRQNGFIKFNNKEDRRNNFKGNLRNEEESKPEKLHPSWEAKKRQSGLLPFQGKKIVFDES